MVDNRGISPIIASNFSADNASANKMSEEKYGQGGEYFAQELEEEENKFNQQHYQDRSAQLRASLNGLAMANAGSIMLMKMLKEKEEQEKKKKFKQTQEQKQEEEKEEESNIED